MFMASHYRLVPVKKPSFREQPKMTRLRGTPGLVLLVMVMLCACFGTVQAAYHLPHANTLLLRYECPEALFVFGASMVDTGNFLASLPHTGTLSVESWPYGMNFFGVPSGRFADGRVLVDYFSQAFQFPLLTPYFRSVAADFRRGANFAYAGSPILDNPVSLIRYHIKVQEQLFLKFKKDALGVLKQSSTGIVSCKTAFLPQSEETFNKGLYIFRYNLRNDFADLLRTGAISLSEARDVYSAKLAAAIGDTVQSMYGNGARQFFLFKSPALGCAPELLTVYANDTSLHKSEHGCVRELNDISDAFNAHLVTVASNLRANLSEAIIFLFDFAAAQREVWDAPSKYGFAKEKLLRACCGIGGRYNYDKSRSCTAAYTENGQSKTVGACADPDQHVNWDGIHDTEAYSRVMATFALTGQFLDPPFNLKEKCHLDFSKFRGANVTSSYPDFIFPS
ncbi:hypothetical protein MPTK1_7g13650 [Marchantia polymorpha subsp. ruderalis]|uniref:Uncharacterized protein n=2 Tax=Marchantia polymorpha TaxID=3197 RepID=A0A176VMU1_MARPO|nr:hypothetical protein AXG93_412s1270 [Marchantia polymorpha subsp. ruderalis]PTQ46930.1 hypothetical protein MARPO_0009s0050 [Marchantia polymorpha]BBN17326.1 hypothetical protein Mp_7g13650 [Marchantia polymorpha subsp. ruderalis]|eukprot:PTQ46930.1 hypothetical protein MARPO_0009s0050 [Marchantia polymorpha]